MKSKKLILIALLVIMGIGMLFFTVLYFVKPRTIHVASFIDAIPDEMTARSAPEVPDTLFTLTDLRNVETRVRVAMQKLIAKAKKEKDTAFLDMISYRERASTAEETLNMKLAEDEKAIIEEVSLVISRKTFLHALLGEDGETSLVDVESMVEVTAPSPATLILNDIMIRPNKILLAEEWQKSLPPPKSNFKQGYYWGLGTTTLIVVTLIATKVIKF